MAVPQLVFAFQNSNHLHVGFGFMFIQDFEPVLDRLAILRFNRREIALRSFDFFTHSIKLLRKDKTPPEGGVLLCGD